MSKKNKINKITGALFGFAIGDAMGATTEFMSDKSIKAIYGKVTDIIGGGWLNLKAGEVTDDTQMMICVINALMKFPNNVRKFKKQCADNFIDWFSTDPIDIGVQCQKGILSLMNGKQINFDKDALGNGSLMRALPCALANNVLFNVQQGVLTHNNQTCSEAIAAYTVLIQRYLNNLYDEEEAAFFMDPAGCVHNTFNNVLYEIQNATNFKDSIINTVNHGGDADTIAALVGGLAGAKYGMGEIPKKWVDKLPEEIKYNLQDFINYL